MEAEAIAIFQAAKHCSHSQYNKVIIQTDSLTLQKILIREWDCPWSILDIIEKIWSLLEYTQVQF